MKLPVCTKCGHRWTWKQSMQQFLAMQHIDYGMTCPYCNQKQYMTKKIHRRLWMLRVIPYLFVFASFFLFSLFVAFACLIISVVVMVWMHPYVMKLSSERASQQKPLW